MLITFSKLNNCLQTDKNIKNVLMEPKYYYQKCIIYFTNKIYFLFLSYINIFQE